MGVCQSNCLTEAAGQHAETCGEPEIYDDGYWDGSNDPLARKPHDQPKSGSDNVQKTSLGEESASEKSDEQSVERVERVLKDLEAQVNQIEAEARETLCNGCL